MINEKEGTIVVVDEENNQLKIQVLFSFEVPDFKKNYVVYITDTDFNRDEIDVLISEYDSETYEIKSIPQDEMSVVLEFYKAAKDIIIGDE